MMHFQVSLACEAGGNSKRVHVYCSFLMVEPREDWEQVKLQFAASGNPSLLRRQESTLDIPTLQATQAKVLLRTGASKF